MLQGHRGCNFQVANICWKMVAKESELGDISDGKGRSKQQQHRLRLRCDFIAAGGVGCNKGTAVIGRRWGSGVHDYCIGGQWWYGARDHCQSCSLRCWLRSRQLAAKDYCGALKIYGSEGSLLVAFVSQRIATGYDQVG
ncbi:hypothetical protein BHE74_00002208 [Ensete ventricosum]|nr:hypothetical protein BHE74_00002208 [Ensete ventricosum]